MNKNTEYGLMALEYMSAADTTRPIKAQEISYALGITFDGLSKVMQKLSQDNFLKSERGASGGYFLNKNLNQISLKEIIESLSGSFIVVRCIDPNLNCKITSKCNIKTPMRRLNEKLAKFYSELNLEEIFQSQDLKQKSTI